MANNVSLIGYTNTFGEWVIATNSLAKENNDLASNNYTKSTGTLYLNEPTLGLQVANSTIIGGPLQVQGIGSSAYVQNTLRVDSQVYFTNTTLGLVNSGQANISGPLFATGSNTSLTVSNNVVIGGNTHIGLNANISGNTIIGGEILVGGNTSIQRNANIIGELFSANLTTRNIQSTGNISSVNLILTDTINSGDIYVGDISSSGSISVDGAATIQSHLTVGGNFVITGSVVYDTNELIINSGSAIGLNSVFGVNRGTSGANAEIRWDESNTQFQIKDVNNPSSYSKILTANLISDSISLNDSTKISSSKSVKTVNDNLVANVNSLNSFIESAYYKANTSFSTIVGTTGSATQNSSSITITSTNGITIVGTGNTLTINTSQDLRSTATPTFNNLTLTYALPIAQGGTGAKTRAEALSNLLPTSTTTGYVLGISAPNTYAWQPNYANSITFTTPYGGISASNNTIQTAIQDVETRKATILSPTFTGTPLSPTPHYSVSNTQIATTSYVNNLINSGTSNNYSYSIGVGTSAPGTMGDILATGQITAYYSDENLKNRLGNIENALEKILSLNGFYYEPNKTALSLGFKLKKEVGVSAQEVNNVLPEIVVPAPIDNSYLTVHYEKLIPLLIEAIKELKVEIDNLKK